MNKIFATCIYRPRNDDYWGFCLSEAGSFLFEASHKDESTLQDMFQEKFFCDEVIFVDQYRFDKHEEFKKARMQSMHTYALPESE